jgi:aldehyde dehydrogenase (NAD+)
MKAVLADNRDRFFATLHQDLRRNDLNSDLMDVGFCIKEAEYALAHMHDWVKAEREPTPRLLEPGHVRVRRDPPTWSCRE